MVLTHNLPRYNEHFVYVEANREDDYVREFKFDAITASTMRRRDSDFIYN